MITIKCPNCKVIYRQSAPDKCSLCKHDLTMEIKKELKKELNNNELYKWILYNENNIKEREDKIKNEQIRIKEEIKKMRFSKLKCSNCQSKNLEMINGSNTLHFYIKCNDCKNIDTRKSYDYLKEKFGSLIKCDICGSPTTEINFVTNLPSWIYTELKYDFNYIKNKILCTKCDNSHHEELKMKEKEFRMKHIVIHYMFDGDALKYWKEGDNNTVFEEIEVDNNYGKSRYNKAIKKMKSNFSKTTKFIDMDE